jgi:PAS domain S-box-containing protein
MGIALCVAAFVWRHVGGPGAYNGSDVVGVVGGVITVVAFLATLGLTRRNAAEQLRAVEDDWRARTTSLQLQFAETRKAEDLEKTSMASQLTEVQAQLQKVSKEHASLQADLDARKKNERNLSQRQQSLESSKTVLELHVQARNRELDKLQRRYELILNSAGEGICGLDGQGKATFVNPTVARLTGWSVEELIGKTEREIFYPNAPEEDTARTGGSGERVFYRKDGTRFLAEVVRTKIEEGGEATGAVLTLKDITERKRAEDALSYKAAELARSNAELEQFAFVASHDLQEPLRKIQAFGDRLKAKSDGVLAPDARDYLDRMQSASARMRTLIDDLLAFSRVIRSSEPFSQVDLGKTTREVLGDLEVRIEKSGATMEVGNLPTIEADPMQMRQLLLNLIGNALKFQAPGTKPLIKINSRTVTTLGGEQLCELTVADNGIGFEEQYAEKIFVVFQRLHGRGEYEGTGIGLAVCRRITDRHHGTIAARSKPGQGATFIVTLPMKQSRGARND